MQKVKHFVEVKKTVLLNEVQILINRPKIQKNVCSTNPQQMEIFVTFLSRTRQVISETRSRAEEVIVLRTGENVDLEFCIKIAG